MSDDLKQDHIIRLLSELAKIKLGDSEKLDLLWKVVIQGDPEAKVISLLETMRRHDLALKGITRLGWALLGSVLTGTATVVIDIVVHLKS